MAEKNIFVGISVFGVYMVCFQYPAVNGRQQRVYVQESGIMRCYFFKAQGDFRKIVMLAEPGEPFVLRSDMLILAQALERIFDFLVRRDFGCVRIPGRGDQRAGRGIFK